MPLPDKQTKALQESLRQWEVVFDGISDGICLLDTDRKILKCNDAMARLLGKKKQQCIGVIICRLLHGTDYPVENCPLNKTCQSGTRESCELEVKNQHFHVTVDPLENDRGKVTRVVHMVRNITDRKRVERDLLFHSAALEQSMDGIAIVDLEGNLQFTNTAFAAMHQYKPDELLGKHLSIFHNERQMREEVNPFLKSIKKIGHAQREITHIRRDGSIVPTTMSCSLLRDSNQKPISIVAVAADITERKKTQAELQKAHDELDQRVRERTKDLTEANKNLSLEILERRRVQEALSESERKFRTLAETISVAVIIIQGDQTLYANRAMQLLTGRTREELYKIPYWELSHPEWRDIVHSRCSDRQHGHDVISRYESEILTASGEQRWVDQSMAMINYDGGRAVLLTALDITKRHRAEEELKAAHVQLVNARERERKNLAAELHDSLAQEMVVLQLMMQRGKDLTGDRDKFIDWLSGAGQMCATMIAKTRSICHGLYPPTLETFGLEKSLENLAEFYQVANVKIKIKNGCEKGKRFSQDVEIALFRIAQEAMSNAIRHGNAKKATIELCYKDGILSEKIIDNGSGFDIDKKKSCGLGLRSMADRADSVGGQLDISSRKGKTCVCVTVATTPVEGSIPATK